MFIIITILPIFFLIILGYVFRRISFPGDAFWSGAARITYFVFFPVLVFRRLAIAEMDSSLFGQVFLIIGFFVPLTLIFLLISKPLYRTTGPAFTSLVQGAVRFNTYIGLAIASSLWGNRGLEMAALLISILIPIVNVVCIIALILYGDKQKTGWKYFFNAIFGNPLIIAAISGLLVNFLPFQLPKILNAMLDILGRPALPLGLITVGAGLFLTHIKQVRGLIIWSVVWKMILLPAGVLASAAIFPFDKLLIGVAFLFAILPTASSAYILAQEMGGDTRAMAAILTVQTFLSMITIPVSLIIFEYFFKVHA